jgi:hypothetical protein
MARIRTAPVMAALTALPLAAVLLAGIALADNGSSASATQRVAGVDGATNQSNASNHHDYDFAFVQVF